MGNKRRPKPFIHSHASHPYSHPSTTQHKPSTLQKAQRELDNVKDILVKFPVPVLSGNIRKPKKLKVPPNNAPEGIK
jgi:hypothetical protein